MVAPLPPSGEGGTNFRSKGVRDSWGALESPKGDLHQVLVVGRRKTALISLSRTPPSWRGRFRLLSGGLLLSQRTPGTQEASDWADHREPPDGPAETVV